MLPMLVVTAGWIVALSLGEEQCEESTLSCVHSAPTPV
jgi:hypothetical protein